MISAQAAADSGADSGARTGQVGAFGGFRTRWALLLSAAGGLAVFASSPPLDVWPLAFAGPGLLVVALIGRSLRASFVCGLVFGLALFVPLLSWLINVAWYAWAASGRGRGGHLRHRVHRPAAAARAPVLAGAGGGVVGGGRGAPGPVALRVPLGRLAMSQSVAPDVRWVAVGGAPLLTFLVALTSAMAARYVLISLGAGPSRRALGGGAGRGGDGGRGARGRPAAGRPDGRRADGHGGGDPGERAAGQEPAAAAERQPGHPEPRGGHREAGRGGQGGGCPRPTW